MFRGWNFYSRKISLPLSPFHLHHLCFYLCYSFTLPLYPSFPLCLSFSSSISLQFIFFPSDRIYFSLSLLFNFFLYLSVSLSLYLYLTFYLLLFLSFALHLSFNISFFSFALFPPNFLSLTLSIILFLSVSFSQMQLEWNSFDLLNQKPYKSDLLFVSFVEVKEF